MPSSRALVATTASSSWPKSGARCRGAVPACSRHGTGGCDRPARTRRPGRGRALQPAARVLVHEFGRLARWRKPMTRAPASTASERTKLDSARELRRVPRSGLRAAGSRGRRCARGAARRRRRWFKRQADEPLGEVVGWRWWRRRARTGVMSRKPCTAPQAAHHLGDVRAEDTA